MSTTILKSDYCVLSSALVTLKTEEWSGLVFIGDETTLSTDFTDFHFIGRETTIYTDEWHGVDDALSTSTVATDKIAFTYTTPRVKKGELINSEVVIESGGSYVLTFNASGMTSQDGVGTITVRQGTQILYTFLTTAEGNKSVTFTADSSGQSVSFDPDKYVVTLYIDNVSLRQKIHPAVNDDRPVKEFLTGETDDGKEIFFRVDTNLIPLGPIVDDPKKSTIELFSNPLQIATRVHRGTEVKCFIGLDKDEFYPLEGTLSRGFPLIKVHSDGNTEPRPVLARKVRLSWRDSSKKSCRLVQAALSYKPTTMDVVE